MRSLLKGWSPATSALVNINFIYFLDTKFNLMIFRPKIRIVMSNPKKGRH